MNTLCKLLTCCLLTATPLLRAQNFVPHYIEGEQLEYLLHYGLINGGSGKLTVRKGSVNNKPVYHAVAEARTIGLADKIYRVRDVYESYMDVRSGLPVKAIRNISEGRYRYYNECVYLRDSNLVISQRSGRIRVPEGIIDMVSALYLIRNIDFTKLQTGDTIKLVTYFADEIYPLNIRYRGKESLKTKLGSFECLVFAPVTEVGRVFKTEDDMLMWITDDPNHIPIRILFDMWVGSLKVDLVSYKNLKYPLAVNK